ncbi:MAG: hypothetical protein U1F11_04875 [Steroidobacteraceae bacterium]
MSTAEYASPTIQSERDSRCSIVRASRATTCIASVMRSPCRSAPPFSSALQMCMSEPSV